MRQAVVTIDAVVETLLGEHRSTWSYTFVHSALPADDSHALELIRIIL